MSFRNSTSDKGFGPIFVGYLPEVGRFSDKVPTTDKGARRIAGSLSAKPTTADKYA